MIGKLALSETQASWLVAEVANEETGHAPAPPLERKQVDAALATIGATLHLMFD